MRNRSIFLMFFITASCKPAAEQSFKAPFEDIKGFFESEAIKPSLKMGFQKQKQEFKLTGKMSSAFLQHLISIRPHGRIVIGS